MQSALGFVPRALAARSWLRGLGVTPPCPHAAPPQHQDPQAGAVYWQTPLQQSRWLSASATTANKMPVPSTGVAPHGGLASTAVESTKRTVAVLKAEEKELLHLVVVVGDIKDSGHHTIDVALKRRLRACGILDIENLDDVLVELKEKLKSVNMRLETACRDLATAREMRDALAELKQPLLAAERLLTNLPEGWQVKKLESDTSLLDLVDLFSKITQRGKRAEVPGTEDIMAELEAEKALPQSALQKELREVYHADLAVGPTRAKKKNVDKLLYRFEIVKKLCHRHVSLKDPVLLKDFFAGGVYADPVLECTHLHMHSPRVSYVESFAAAVPVTDNTADPASGTADPADEVARLLLGGSTVVSRRQSEPGVEYLSPFFKRPFDPSRPYEYADLLVAMVQVKYLNPRTLQNFERFQWGTYAKHVDTSDAKAYLEARRIANFTVFYTLSDKVPKRKNMKRNTVYYDRDGMKLFTKKLGPLLYHEGNRG